MLVKFLFNIFIKNNHQYLQGQYVYRLFVTFQPDQIVFHHNNLIRECLT